MNATKSILCLWLGSSATACFVVFAFAYYRGSMAALSGDNLDLGGGQSFALAVPPFLSLVFALMFFFVALVGLLVSWLYNKQRLLSMPHVAALLFLAPMVLVILYAVIFDA